MRFSTGERTTTTFNLEAPACHSRAGGKPEHTNDGVPACAGMTWLRVLKLFWMTVAQLAASIATWQWLANSADVSGKSLRA